MSNSTLVNILQKNKLRITDNRISILGQFIENEFALTHQELELSLEHLDRVTIYRTLNSFLEKGIIHKVIDGDGAAKFAACSEACDEHSHHDEHIHFKCRKCGLTRCIDTISIPEIKLPDGYKMEESNYLVTGLCKNC